MPIKRVSKVSLSRLVLQKKYFLFDFDFIKQKVHMPQKYLYILLFILIRQLKSLFEYNKNNLH